MRPLSMFAAAAALASLGTVAAAQITNVPIGNVNANDDWKCTTTIEGTTYVATGSVETDAQAKLIDAGYTPPFACIHRDDAPDVAAGDAAGGDPPESQSVKRLLTLP